MNSRSMASFQSTRFFDKIIIGYRATRTLEGEDKVKESIADLKVAARYVELGGGGGKKYYALIDAEDFERVSRFRWTVTDCSRHGTLKLYARRSEWNGISSRTVYLHRFIMGEPFGLVVDHENGDGLDCRRANMTVVPQKINAAAWRQRKQS